MIEVAELVSLVRKKRLGRFRQKSFFLKISGTAGHRRVLSLLLDLLLEAGCDGDADDGEHEAGEEDDALVVRDPLDVEAQQGAAGDQVHRDAEPVKKQK